MLKLLSEFLRSPQDFFKDEHRQRIVIISLFSLLPVCVVLSMVKGAARRSNAFESLTASPTPIAPPTQTKWWVRHEQSETASGLLPSLQTPMGDSTTSMLSNKCPAYAAAFKPGTFGHISLFPPYENLVCSGAGKNCSSVGSIEIGGWVKILAEPVCADDGYVWLNVESTSGSNNWTAGGHKTAQWVIPCPDPNKKCSKKRSPGLLSATAHSNNNNNSDDGKNAKACAADNLAVGVDAQASPNDLLVVHSEPFIGSILGRIALRP